MEKKRGFLQAYLIIAVLLALVSIADGILTLLKWENALYTTILLIISGLFFFFNILAISYFHYHRIERIAYILPIYYLINYLLCLGAGVALALTNFSPPWLNFTLIGINFTEALFEIAFSVYLWKKLIFI